jgi:hypothetical protein
MHTHTHAYIHTYIIYVCTCIHTSEHRFVDFPHNSARWWGETWDGFGYDARSSGYLGKEEKFDRFSTPVGRDVDHYTYPRDYRNRGSGHRFDFSPSQVHETQGWGPVYYGDTKIYGASVGRDYAKQPYPVYTDYMTQNAARAAGVESEYATRNLEMEEGYMEGFAKDFFAYFPKQDAAVREHISLCMRERVNESSK